MTLHMIDNYYDMAYRPIFAQGLHKWTPLQDNTLAKGRIVHKC